jgi:hypothetical protein
MPHTKTDYPNAMPAWMLKCKKLWYPYTQLQQKFYLLQIPAEVPRLEKISCYSSQKVLDFDVTLHLYLLPLKGPCKVPGRAFHANNHNGKALAFAFSGFNWRKVTPKISFSSPWLVNL